jgi:hypothetical protein
MAELDFLDFLLDTEEPEPASVGYQAQRGVDGDKGPPTQHDDSIICISASQVPSHPIASPVHIPLRYNAASASSCVAAAKTAHWSEATQAMEDVLSAVGSGTASTGPQAACHLTAPVISAAPLWSSLPDSADILLRSSTTGKSSSNPDDWYDEKRFTAAALCLLLALAFPADASHGSPPESPLLDACISPVSHCRSPVDLAKAAATSYCYFACWRRGETGRVDTRKGLQYKRSGRTASNSSTSRGQGSSEAWQRHVEQLAAEARETVSKAKAKADATPTKPTGKPVHSVGSPDAAAAKKASSTPGTTTSRSRSSSPDVVVVASRAVPVYRDTSLQTAAEHDASALHQVLQLVDENPELQKLSEECGSPDLHSILARVLVMLPPCAGLVYAALFGGCRSSPSFSPGGSLLGFILHCLMETWTVIPPDASTIASDISHALNLTSGSDAVFHCGTIITMLNALACCNLTLTAKPHLTLDELTYMAPRSVDILQFASVLSHPILAAHLTCALRELEGVSQRMEAARFIGGFLGRHSAYYDALKQLVENVERKADECMMFPHDDALHRDKVMAEGELDLFVRGLVEPEGHDLLAHLAVDYTEREDSVIRNLYTAHEQDRGGKQLTSRKEAVVVFLEPVLSDAEFPTSTLIETTKQLGAQTGIYSHLLSGLLELQRLGSMTTCEVAQVFACMCQWQLDFPGQKGNYSYDHRCWIRAHMPSRKGAWPLIVFDQGLSLSLLQAGMDAEETAADAVDNTALSKQIEDVSAGVALLVEASAHGDVFVPRLLKPQAMDWGRPRTQFLVRVKDLPVKVRTHLGCNVDKDAACATSGSLFVSSVSSYVRPDVLREIATEMGEAKPIPCYHRPAAHSDETVPTSRILQNQYIQALATSAVAQHAVEKHLKVVDSHKVNTEMAEKQRRTLENTKGEKQLRMAMANTKVSALPASLPVGAHTSKEFTLDASLECNTLSPGTFIGRKLGGVMGTLEYACVLSIDTMKRVIETIDASWEISGDGDQHAFITIALNDDNTPHIWWHPGMKVEAFDPAIACTWKKWSNLTTTQSLTFATDEPVTGTLADAGADAADSVATVAAGKGKGKGKGKAQGRVVETEDIRPFSSFVEQLRHRAARQQDDIRASKRRSMIAGALERMPLDIPTLQGHLESLYLGAWPALKADILAWIRAHASHKAVPGVQAYVKDVLTRYEAGTGKEGGVRSSKASIDTHSTVTAPGSTSGTSSATNGASNDEAVVSVSSGTKPGGGNKRGRNITAQSSPSAPIAPLAAPAPAAAPVPAPAPASASVSASVSVSSVASTAGRRSRGAPPPVPSPLPSSPVPSLVPAPAFVSVSSTASATKARSNIASSPPPPVAASVSVTSLPTSGNKRGRTPPATTPTQPSASVSTGMSTSSRKGRTPLSSSIVTPVPVPAPVPVSLPSTTAASTSVASTASTGNKRGRGTPIPVPVSVPAPVSGPSSSVASVASARSAKRARHNNLD